MTDANLARRHLGRAGGAALLMASGGTVLAMAHHPSSLQPGLLNGALHGLLILLLAANAFGFAAFAAARGLMRPAVLGGVVAYAFGSFGHLGAGLMNGFIVPALAGRDEAVGPDLFLFAWEINQALAAFGVIAAGSAFSLWSIDLLHRQSSWSRMAGLAGLLLGLGSIAALLTGIVRMDVGGALLLYGAHALWSALIGYGLLRGKAAASG